MPGRRFSAEEREEIRVGLARGESLRGIARRLGRAASSVCREVSRNAGRERYQATAAERRAQRCRARPKQTKFQFDPTLARRVENRLAAKDSPMTIARALAAEGSPLSHETIYRAIYAHGRRGLAAGLHAHLHRRRRCRKRRLAKGEQAKKASPLGNFNPISSRPEIAGTRSEVGHFEGDLIIGERGRSAVVTLVDRASRFNLLGDLPRDHGADSVLACLVELIGRVPPELRRTLTWDQGREMARWHELVELSGIQVYFAEPHSPWQRPSNEAFNGLLRRWLPKSSNLSVYDQDDLDAISHQINTMPRRSLRWQSAHECYHRATVALTG